VWPDGVGINKPKKMHHTCTAKTHTNGPTRDAEQRTGTSSLTHDWPTNEREHKRLEPKSSEHKKPTSRSWSSSRGPAGKLTTRQVQWLTGRRGVAPNACAAAQGLHHCTAMRARRGRAAKKAEKQTRVVSSTPATRTRNTPSHSCIGQRDVLPFNTQKTLTYHAPRIFATFPWTCNKNSKFALRLVSSFCQISAAADAIWVLYVVVALPFALLLFWFVFSFSELQSFRLRHEVNYNYNSYAVNVGAVH